MSIEILRGAAADATGAGGKARALARAERAGLPVPPWFVIVSSLDGVPDSCEMDATSAETVVAAAQALAGVDGLLAVRSSASDEDGAAHSFAGQLESYLNVRVEDVPARVVDVWRSGFSERVLAYRREHGLTPMPRIPGVLVQRMVPARSAGVAFAADPVSGRRGVAVVSAVHGLGDALVAGEADGDTWRIDRAGTILDVQAGPRPALTDDEARQVAALAREASAQFGRPQDIEWAIADRLYLLQSRPITSLLTRADPDAPLVIWDNSNIVESYSGITTPLTFSFAREIYEHVYRQFCRLMQVPDAVIDSRTDMFENMLGLIRGRLYYNLLNWYRLLALLPGYQINRRFMEGMMGVKEALPADIADAIAVEASRGKLKDLVHLARTVTALGAHHLTLNRSVDAFYRRLDAALAPPSPPLADRRIDELVAHYRDLRQRLLLHWDAPLINDFFAMIFYGLLRALVTRWCDDPGGTLQNDLIGGEGGIVSAEPAIRMQQLARIAAEDPELLESFRVGTVEQITAILATRPEPRALVGAYLDKFGDRTVNELKLESYTLHDNALPFYRAVAALATLPLEAGSGSSADRLRAASRDRAAAALRTRPIRRVVFSWVLKHARRRVRDRENLRLERTRLFGRVRRIFLEIGRRLQSLDLLDGPRDIFYLEVNEVLAFAEGRATTTDLRSLVAIRQREFKSFSALEAPASRFETRGAVYQGHTFQPPASQLVPGEDELRGLGCSPGVVRGRVRVVADPTTVEPSHGSILVAEHTDPGWIMVFPSSRGVLVERGSLLSHAAIVARELGIPAIVSLPGLTHRLRDGDVVEMDGSTGIVRKVVVSHAE